MEEDGLQYFVWAITRKVNAECFIILGVVSFGKSAGTEMTKIA